MSGAQFTGRAAGTIAGQARTQHAAAGTRLRTSRHKTAGSSGLSLRTRLLLLQIAVTAVFLLIMGIVSTALFPQHLKTQFPPTILPDSPPTPPPITHHP